MNYPHFYIILLSALSISTQLYALQFSESVTVYDLLKSYNLPSGLFPKGVKDFSFDDSGTFQVYLDQPCNSMYENELHYDRNISGVLTLGKIDQLSGISAKDLFLWFQVKEIRVDIPSSGLIYFDVGVVSKQFSLSSFETPKECLAVQLLESRGFVEKPVAAYKAILCSLLSNWRMAAHQNKWGHVLEIIRWKFQISTLSQRFGKGYFIRCRKWQ